MKKYIRANDYFLESCKKSARDAGNAIWSFQNKLVGDPALSDALSNEDIEILDKARIILDNYAEGV